VILRLICLCGLAVALWAAPAHARDALDEPGFATVGDTRTITDGVVTALAQDERGLIWIGTAVGLVRHDGYQLRRVTVGGKPATPAATPAASPASGAAAGGSSFVRALLAAPGGVLWVGLEGEGLARLDTQRQLWTRFAPDAHQAGALSHGTVRALAMDLDGALWVGTTGGGLHRLAPQASTFTHYQRASGALPDDRVQALWVDRRGDLWVGTWNGLVRLARGSTRFEPMLADPSQPGSLAGRIVTMLGEAPDGRIWAGTRQGDLVLIDPATGQGVPAPAAPMSFSAMAAGTGDEIWLSGDNGIQLRNVADGRIVKHLQRDRAKPWGLAANNVVAVLRDRSGVMWAGSYGGGLQRSSPGAGLWVRRGEGGADHVLAEGDTRSLFQLRSGEIWAGMSDRGVAVLDLQLRLLAQIRPEPGRPGAFAGGTVGAIAQAPDGSVWVGTESRVYQFSPNGACCATSRRARAARGACWPRATAVSGWARKTASTGTSPAPTALSA
jgi:ligand-binding sensor domain-containing protein